jgi:hypothetical protein
LLCVITKQEKIGFRWLLTAGMLWLASCQSSSPTGVLSEKEMIQAIMDVYILEEKVSRMPVPYDSMAILYPRFFSKYLQEQKISEEQFKTSWNYYMNDPRKMEAIYAAVVDSLNLREQAFPRGTTSTDAASE